MFMHTHLVRHPLAKLKNRLMSVDVAINQGFARTQKYRGPGEVVDEPTGKAGENFNIFLKNLLKIAILSNFPKLKRSFLLKFRL